MAGEFASKRDGQETRVWVDGIYYTWSPTGANDFHRPWFFGVLKFR